MKFTTNITDADLDLQRYQGPEDLRDFLKKNRLNGLELMPCMGTELPDGWEPRDIVGVHLMYYYCWLDFWRGDEEALNREFDCPENWKMFYSGGTLEGILKTWRKQLDMAQRIGARYVVFHVSECVLQECVTYRYLHTDREVCQAACDLINMLLDGGDYDFWFLCENLWWSGMSLRDPEVTRELMEGIHYPKKGIMLDTGHLLNTNLDLESQEEGVAYIHHVLDRMEDLTHYIKGIHLNQSISGEYVKSVIANPPQMKGDYWHRLNDLSYHIYTIDHHEPFTASGVGTILSRLKPEFVTFEFITKDRQQHEKMLQEQWKALPDFR